ncbi:MAG: AbrB family transcriptional regulator [Pseudomonadota bacterium]|nr:AbrB family transcriptional regulator [Pseudomonadota bacterium]
MSGRRRIHREQLRRLALALVVGAGGGFAFQALHLPLAWMLGPMTFNLAAALLRLPVAVPLGLRSAMQVVLGVFLGSAFSPEIAGRVGQWPWSLAGIALFTLVSTALVAWYYRRLAGLDRITALYSATPGAMTAMILMGAAAGGDERRIALAQALRITLVVLMVPPLVVSLASGLPAAPTLTAPVIDVPVYEVLLLVAGSGGGLLLARWLRLPAAELAGPMIISAALYLAGWVHLALPAPLLAVTLWILGSAVGARFAGVRPQELLRLGRYALGAVLLALTLAAAFAAVLSLLPGVGFLAALLALAPGGVAEMCMIAVAWNIDPAFVASHHLARMLLLIALAPWAGKLLGAAARR